MEIWKDIKGYEGKYQISNTGKVKSLQYHRGREARILKTRYTTRKGSHQYYYVMLSKDNKVKCGKIHRLVAEYFVPNPEPETKVYVNHKDGNKHNNHYTNLEWVTPLENNLHAYRVLGKCAAKSFRYDKSWSSKKVEQWWVSEEGYEYHIATYASAKVAAEINKLHATGITQCCKKNPKHGQCGGYVWKYAVQE
jgi:hypothetical protein